MGLPLGLFILLPALNLEELGTPRLLVPSCPSREAEDEGSVGDEGRRDREKEGPDDVVEPLNQAIMEIKPTPKFLHKGSLQIFFSLKMVSSTGKKPIMYS